MDCCNEEKGKSLSIWTWFTLLKESIIAGYCSSGAAELRSLFRKAEGVSISAYMCGTPTIPRIGETLGD